MKAARCRRDFGAQRGVNEAHIQDPQQFSNDLSAVLSAIALAKAEATSEGGSQRPRGPARAAQAHPLKRPCQRKIPENPGKVRKKQKNIPPRPNHQTTRTRVAGLADYDQISAIMSKYNLSRRRRCPGRPTLDRRPPARRSAGAGGPAADVSAVAPSEGGSLGVGGWTAWRAVAECRRVDSSFASFRVLSGHIRPWTVDCGPRTADRGLWTVDCGLPSVSAPFLHCFRLTFWPLLFTTHSASTTSEYAHRRIVQFRVAFLPIHL
jgi:hypothetical protein